MVKWFKAHTRQIYALLAVLSFVCMLSCACFGVSAYVNQPLNSLIGIGQSNPTVPVPSLPTVGDEEFVQDNYYLNSLSYTYPRYKPLFNYSVGVICEDQREEVVLYEFDVGSNITYVLGDNDIDKSLNYNISGSPVGTIKVQSSFDDYGIITDRISIYGKSSYDDLVIFFDDFYFTPTWLEDAPSAGVDDTICTIRYDESWYKNSNGEVYITGSISYVGNVTSYEIVDIPFEYYLLTDTEGDIDIMYGDIVYNAIYQRYGEYYASQAMENNVPIYIKDLRVYDDVQLGYDPPAIDISVEYRNQTVGEYYMYSIDKQSLYEGMLKYYSEVVNELPSMDWIIESISGFMNTPLFGAISFGAIFTMIFSYAIVKVVLEVFKG